MLYSLCLCIKLERVLMFALDAFLSPGASTSDYYIKRIMVEAFCVSSHVLMLMCESVK